jgi:hypothetical protein
MKKSEFLPLIVMHRCPACGLPITAAELGGAIATPTNGPQHAIVAICRRCAATASRIPPGTYRKMMDRAATRALGDPDRYLLTTMPNAGAARLAIGLLAHPAHALEALSALGWGDGVGRRN